MSSRKWIWAVVVIVIILLGLWYFGVFNSSVAAPTQSAAVNTGATSAAMTAQNSVIKADVASLDGQMAATNAALTAITGPATKPQIASIAASFKGEAALFAKIATEMRAASTNAQTSGASVAGIQAAMTDLNNQLSNMTSQASTAAKNTAAAGSTAATVAASLKQLQTAQTYATAARADIQSIVQTLGIK